MEMEEEVCSRRRQRFVILHVYTLGMSHGGAPLLLGGSQ